ncbi:Transcription elongation factor spt6 [Coemansia sp. RSA 2322]|nr:Transcription elongation factor spt6 [Coemansia sp. RSA 2322]
MRRRTRGLTRTTLNHDDEDEDEDDEDDNDDELRREGFLVDDDDVEEEGADSRRKRRRKKKRRHASHDPARDNDSDELDEEDLALVAENTNQDVAFSAAPGTGSKFKRLKRGRARQADDDDELRAELDDLMDTGEDGGGGQSGGEGGERGRRRAGYEDDLGLFGNEEDDDSDISANDYRVSRRMDRGRSDGARRRGAEREDHAAGGRHDSSGNEAADDPLGPAGRGREAEAGAAPAGGGGVANYMFDSLEAIDDDTWMELQDIFGDGEEYAFAMEAAAGEADAGRERTLADVFEPAELEAKMMTQRDDDIRATDIPERIQARATGGEWLRALSEEEVHEATTWIIGRLRQARARHEGAGLFAQVADFMSDKFLMGVIGVLTHMAHDFFEVPYIAQHCREQFVTPVAAGGGDGGGDGDGATHEWLGVDDLWSLHDHEQQFRGFLASRRAVKNMLRRAGEGAGEGAGIAHADEAYASEFVAAANCVEDIGDVADWLQLHCGAAIRSGNQHRRARGAGVLEAARASGADGIVARMGITARQVGENISSPGRHFVEDLGSAVAPLDVARELVGRGHFATPDRALAAGVATFAQLLAADPHMRRHVRAYCDAHACVVVRPTARGLREITHEDHAAFAFKFLTQKPVAAFAGSPQFIALDKAVRGGLLRMAFSLTGECKFDARDAAADAAVFAQDRERSARVLARQIEPHMRSYAVHDAADAWNRVRCDALLAAIRDHVLPLVWRETAQRLLQRASDFVADACRRALQRRVDVQPVVAPRTGPADAPRVLVVAGGGFDASSRGALRAVYVDEHGRYREHFSADSMRRQAGAMAGDGDGVEPLLELLAREPVDVVAVAGMSLQTKRLYEDVKALVDSHCAQAAADIVVTYACDEPARLWWDCDAARAELPDLRKEERYCVSVARTLQSPVAEYAALGPALLKLRLHPAQRDVDQPALLAVIERALINVVAKTGVDVNDLAAHPHKQPLLQYVSGLGPRKAHAILSKIGPDPDRMLESRNDLITRRLCTRYVFVNCASFLRIRPAVLDLLDSTRIHPQDYILAYKMALDALDIEEDVADDGGRRGGAARKKADGPSRYVAEVMRKAPEKLDELDLEGYAQELRRKDLHKLETLKFIKHEMQHPNDDPRERFEQPSDKQVLEMLTGEVLGETLKEDGTSLVSGTIVRVQPRFAIARLDSGLEGFIGVANVTDYRIEEASDELSVGQSIVAVVKRVDLEKMSLDLTMRPSDIEDACKRAQKVTPDSDAVDKYFDLDAEAVLRERANALKLKAATRTRVIPHPLFKPLNSREAELYLASRPRGDCVIRPSSRGPNHIAITWKVAEGLFQHIDVQERDKPNESALGATFLVGESAFSDLDELVAFHVDPIARKLEEVKLSPKFYDPETDPLYAAQPVATILGANDFSDDYKKRRQDLWESRTVQHLDTLAQSTGRGSYCISLSLSKPGSLLLAFKPTPKYHGIMKWTARVEPSEFKLGDRGRYPDLNGLINGFKRMQTSSTSAAATAAAVAAARDSRPSAAAYDSSRSSHRHQPGADSSGSRWGDAGRDSRNRDQPPPTRSNAWGEYQQQQPAASSSSQRHSSGTAAGSSRWGY